MAKGKLFGGKKAPPFKKGGGKGTPTKRTMPVKKGR